MTLLFHLLLSIFAYYVVYVIVWGFLAVFVFNISEEQVNADNYSKNVRKKLKIISSSFSLLIVILLNIYLF